MQDLQKRLIVVSNRLPVAISQENDHWTIAPGSGGLVTALAPVMKQNQGVWVGWPGCDEAAPVNDLCRTFAEEQGYQLQPVPLTEEEESQYYRGFSNACLWPLFHDMLGHCRFDQHCWQQYQEVNRRFAEQIAKIVQPGDFIWVHDYQLALVGAYLKQMGVSQKVGYFLHIPFPHMDLYRRLPWGEQLLRGLLEYDLLGFQTLRDRRNFVNCVSYSFQDVKVRQRQRRRTLLAYDGRTVKVGHFPISIDFREFNDRARSKEVADAAWFLHEHYSNYQLVLGVDRLDYTKGLLQRFYAFERTLEKYSKLRQQISLLQVVVPSRTRVPGYQDLKEQLDQLAGRINASFAEAGWVPIHYVFRSLSREQLLAHYRASEIALITPSRDGMNLVAKEYCASSVEEQGVLILSEFAGAADQLARGAILVNPYDLEGTADAIYQAYHMPKEERRQRMRALRAQIRRNDVHRWVQQFVSMAQET